MLTSRDQATSLDYLPECLLDLHDGMPASVSNAPMRLLKVDAVLSWPTLRVYEEVQPDECIDVPYSDVNEDTWAQTAVLSWRCGLTGGGRRERREMLRTRQGCSVSAQGQGFEVASCSLRYTTSRPKG